LSKAPITGFPILQYHEPNPEQKCWKIMHDVLIHGAEIEESENDEDSNP